MLKYSLATSARIGQNRKTILAPIIRIGYVKNLLRKKKIFPMRKQNNVTKDK